MLCLSESLKALCQRLNDLGDSDYQASEARVKRRETRRNRLRDVLATLLEFYGGVTVG